MDSVSFVSGGAGFIGANLVHHIVATEPEAKVIVYDALTYAGNLDNIEALTSPGDDGSDARVTFVDGDICDRDTLRSAIEKHRPTTFYHLAAESHVDRSIDGPGVFVQTNVVGTFEMLEAARWLSDNSDIKPRFVHVSTDEVYGSLGKEGLFMETTPYAPNSPYAASKAAADHLARAYHQTYGLDVVTTNCSNNYGPYQFPEKLTPLVILNAMEGKPLPVYGDGANIRDWLYVGDHCSALVLAAQKGRAGETYNIGASEEKTTLQMVHALCDALHELRPRESGTYRDLITFVRDRPGHDRRYAIDATKVSTELGWKPAAVFDEGIRKTVRWYLDNQTWCKRISDGVYRRERLGLKA